MPAGSRLFFKKKTRTIELTASSGTAPSDGVLLLEARGTSYTRAGLLGSLMTYSMAISSKDLISEGTAYIHYGGSDTRFVFMDNPRTFVKPDGATGSNNSIPFKVGGSSIDMIARGGNAFVYSTTSFMQDMEDAGVVYTDASGGKWVAAPAWRVIGYSQSEGKFKVIPFNKNAGKVMLDISPMLVFLDKQCIAGGMAWKFNLDMELHTLRNVNAPLGFSIDAGSAVMKRAVGYRAYIGYNGYFKFPRRKSDLLYNQRVKWRIGSDT